jgi:hypothetical protein
MTGLDIYSINPSHVKPLAGPSSLAQNPQNSQIPQRLYAGEQSALLGPDMPMGEVPGHAMQTDLASETSQCQAPVSYIIIKHLDPASVEAESTSDCRSSADPHAKMIVDGVTLSMMTELESRDLVDR